MDQADLDFGIYLVMNTKRDEVERFLEHDLLPSLLNTLEAFQPAELADWKGFADRHVLFQKETPEYVAEVFRRALGCASN